MGKINKPKLLFNKRQAGPIVEQISVDIVGAFRKFTVSLANELVDGFFESSRGETDIPDEIETISPYEHANDVVSDVRRAYGFVIEEFLSQISEEVDAASTSTYQNISRSKLSRKQLVSFLLEETGLMYVLGTSNLEEFEVIDARELDELSSKLEAYREFKNLIYTDSSKLSRAQREEVDYIQANFEVYLNDLLDSETVIFTSKDSDSYPNTIYSIFYEIAGYDVSVMLQLMKLEKCRKVLSVTLDVYLHEKLSMNTYQLSQYRQALIRQLHPDNLVKGRKLIQFLMEVYDPEVMTLPSEVD